MQIRVSTLGVKIEDNFLSKKYVLLVSLVFLALAAMTFAFADITYLTTTASIANQTQTQVITIRQTVTPESIFLNNFKESILSVVPLAGIILFGRVWLNTSRAIGQLAYAYHTSPFLYVIGVYLPVGTIESTAYSVIVTEGLFLTYALFKGDIVERLKKQTWKSILLYLALLAIAATVEAALIKGT